MTPERAINSFLTFLGLVSVLLAAALTYSSSARADPVDCETIGVGSVSVDATSIALGDSTTLHWTFDGPNDCPLWINDSPLGTFFGNMLISPQTLTAYVLTTLGPGGTRRQLYSVSVSVTPDCINEVSGYIRAMPRTVHKGNSSALTWYASAPAACQFTYAVNGVASPSTGVKTVRPATTAEYGITASLPGAVKSVAKATVTVNASVVYIENNTQQSKDKLVAALQTDGTRVVLRPNINLDLTGYSSIYIREGVVFTGDNGDPPRPIRNARNPGPRIFTKSRPRPLFTVLCNGKPDDDIKPTIVGDEVRISGFSIIGPHFGVVDGDSNLESAVEVRSCLDVELSNLEVAGWSGAAIAVEDEHDRIFNPDSVSIRGSYIHNNQHVGGFGYGITMSPGAYARIERNVFDLNRHAVTGTGDAGVGYFAGDNLILKGGGIHGTFFNSFTQQFDVHGDRNCPPIFSALWNCGKAGDQFWFNGNAFQYNRDTALKIRGLPRVAAYINGNVFAHNDIDDAVELFTKYRVYFGTGLKRNITGYDTYGRYGICDLDGDGKDDFFLATGKTWWYTSAARLHWVFLKAASERLEDIGLGDFDGDGRCDVIAPGVGKWEISSGGSGGWKALPGTYTMPFNQLRFADFNGDGRTDIFHRAPDGQWRVISPGVHAWKTLQNSSQPLSALRFGDFTGDGKADVLSRAGGHWSISVGGTAAWTKLNTLSENLDLVQLADVDGNGTDDIVRFKTLSAKKGEWLVSWSGRTPWRSLRTVVFPGPPTAPRKPLVFPKLFVGQFDGLPGDDLLFVDYERVGQIYSHRRKTLLIHNQYPY